MRTSEMVDDYVYRSNRCLREAEQAIAERDFAGAVRRSQEALELAIKAVLRYLAVEYPREHDVGDGLDVVQDKLPDYLKEKLPNLKQLLTELARVRGPAFYGYEREGIPASKAFGEDYAETTFKKVKEYMQLCLRFLER